MESYFSTKKIFNLIVKWKFHLVVFIILAAVLSVVFTSESFIEPKYESYAIVYPASFVTFSDESETEQMIEIMQSNDIMFQIIKDYNLAEHYEIKEGEKQFLHKLIQAYKNNISIKKTANEAVEILVKDKDPEIASQIVSSIIDLYNAKLLNLNKQKSKELVKIYKNEKDRKQLEIDSLSQVITKIRKDYGILHMSAQVEKYTEAISSGKNLNEAREVLTGWKEMGSEYQKTDSLFFFAISDFHKAKSIYESAVRDTQKIQSYTHIISSPFASDKKAYPVRWVFVLFSVIGTFFISLIIIALVENSKESNQ